MNNVTLELEPLEAGFLMGVMIKEMSRHPENKSIIEPVYDKLHAECKKLYYEGVKND